MSKLEKHVLQTISLDVFHTILLKQICGVKRTYDRLIDATQRCAEWVIQRYKSYWMLSRQPQIWNRTSYPLSHKMNALTTLIGCVCNSEFKWPFQIMAIIARKWPSCETAICSSQTAIKHTEKWLAVDFLELWSWQEILCQSRNLLADLPFAKTCGHFDGNQTHPKLDQGTVDKPYCRIFVESRCLRRQSPLKWGHLHIRLMGMPFNFDPHRVAIPW
jgi:hypothetical protein